MKSSVGLSLFGFLVCALCGAAFSYYSWSGAVKRPRGMRDPANINKQYDFSSLNGADLRAASQNRIISDLKILNDIDKFGVEFGHFFAQSPEGRTAYACDIYNQVQLTFHAEGVAESGESPTMMVESKCVISESADSRVAPIWIPYRQVMAEPARNFMIQYPEFGVDITFEFLSGDWPQNWVLDRIRMYNSDRPSQEITVEPSDLKAMLAQPLGVNWDSAEQLRIPTSESTH